MYDLERFYGTKVGFYKGTDSYKSYKLVQTPNFSFWLMPYMIPSEDWLIVSTCKLRVLRGLSHPEKSSWIAV